MEFINIWEQDDWCSHRGQCHWRCTQHSMISGQAKTQSELQEQIDQHLKSSHGALNG